MQLSHLYREMGEISSRFQLEAQQCDVNYVVNLRKTVPTACLLKRDLGDAYLIGLLDPDLVPSYLSKKFKKNSSIIYNFQ